MRNRLSARTGGFRQLLVTLLLAALSVRCANTAGEVRAGGAATGEARPSIAQFMGIRAPNNPALAGDGTLYARDWADGIQQLHRFDASGVSTAKLTSFPDGLNAFSLSPDGTKITLAAASGGNEQDQLYLLPAHGDGTSAVTPLLQDPDVVFRNNVWLSDSSGFIYTANDVSPSDFYVYRYVFASGPASSGSEPRKTRLLAREGSWSAQDVTRDGARVLVGRFVSESDRQVYELDTPSGALSELSFADSSGTSSTAAVGYMPGETSVLLASDHDGGTRRLWQLHSRTGATSRPLRDLDAF